MRSYGQYCPVAKASELLGDRWTLLIVRELLFGPLRFTMVERGLPGISRSVLASRLKRLRRDGIAETHADGAYRLTEAGEALRPVVLALGDWVARWVMADPTPAELDPELLALFISRSVDREALPDRRTVLEFQFISDPPRRIWMTLERHDVSVCLEDPLLPIELVIRCAVSDLFRVYMGRASLYDGLRDGRIELVGLPATVRAFHTWMKWSSFAAASRQAMQRQSQ
jgi:DNA-binding HxlR family transcriptional regulator